LKKLRSLNREEQIQVIPKATQDPLLSSLIEQQNITEKGLALRSKELGEKHPDVINSKLNG